ncbi:filamentous hemagglutinin N-terminal domain-containing protein [Roseateles microcysteis]|uniref:two-partner secretion domain-containing protein n=1 Tax=Roseateles microcysteis TaxID=3119057 RepID=UPI002FE64FD0
MKTPLKTALALALLGALPALAQIRTDASLGQAAQSLVGPNFLIGQNLGKLSGSNLFHSFQTFNIASGESATFTTSTAGITNVISRVTGGEASWINGQVSLLAASGKPAFFFINPAGVVFGAGASIDVPGAFHVSTADSLKFADGTRLQVDLSKTSSFSSAAPEAFGFLGAQSQPVVVYDGAVLATNAGQSMNLQGGDLLVDNAILVGSADIRLAAVGKQALDLPLTGAPPALSGQIILRNEALIGSANLGSLDAGRIMLDAGSITLSGLSSISSYARAATSGKGAAISLRAAGNVLISDGANLYSTAAGAGDAGDINVEGNGIRLELGGYIEGGSLTGSTGRGGTVQLLARQGLTLDSEATISYGVRGSGAGGNISLTAESIDMAGDASITNVALLGRAGAIKLQASGGLKMDSGAMVRNLASGSGVQGGDIEMNLGGDLMMNGRSQFFATGLSGGNSGNIALTARHMSLDGNSFVSTSALYDDASSGNVSLTASGTLSLNHDSYISSNTYSDRNGGAITLRAQSLLMSNGAQLNSTAFENGGNAGNIDVEATQRIEMSGSSSLGSATLTNGNGGRVRVAAPLISLDSKASIYTTAGLGSLGNAGQIEISAPTRLSMSGGSLIDSSSSSLLGNAGNIVIGAGSIEFTGSGIASRSLLPAGKGLGGSINLQASGKVSLSQDSLISTSTSSTARGGSISISASDLLLDHSSLLSLALPGSRGAGGNIELDVTGQLIAVAGSFISATTYGSGAGGAVQLRARDMVFEGLLTGVSASATASSGGQVGGIDIRASGRVSLLNGASLTANNNGEVSNPTGLQPTVLSVTARELAMQGGEISTSSFGNVAANRIAIATSDATRLQNSGIGTSANEGNGGAISLQAGRLLVLDNSLLTTSVFGSQGNGGNVSIGADLMLMKTGFVQANTTAALASGGLVAINVNGLVASGNSLFVGGELPLEPKAGVFGFNVIQAAAPTGVSGVIAITSPVLDLSGSLSVLEARPIDTGGLGRNPCQTREGSSLSQAGRGGLPASARGLLGGDGMAAGEVLAAPPRTLAKLGPAAGGCR